MQTWSRVSCVVVHRRTARLRVCARTQWLAFFSSSPSSSCYSSQPQLCTATVIAVWDGWRRQTTQSCWDDLRTFLATKRMPHDARMARKSAMRCATLLSGPCPFQVSSCRCSRRLQLLVRWCKLWRNHHCNAGRRRCSSFQCGALYQNAVPCPARACCRIWAVAFFVPTD